MRSGETIKVPNEYGELVEINAVVIYPQTNKQQTMYWKVEGMFGSYGFTLCITTDKREAMDRFREVNEELIRVHEEDLRTRY